MLMGIMRIIYENHGLIAMRRVNVREFELRPCIMHYNLELCSE